MIGLAEKTVCMGVEEAKEYVMAKLIVLHEMKKEVMQQLDEIENEIDKENEQLHFLENPPAPQAKCCCECDEADTLSHVVGRLLPF